MTGGTAYDLAATGSADGPYTCDVDGPGVRARANPSGPAPVCDPAPRGRYTLEALRTELEPFVERPLRSALRSLLQDLIVQAALVAVVLGAGSLWLRLGAGLGVGLVATNLFMIGHDAAHGSFTGHSRLNRAIAAIGLTLAFHPVAAWRHIHHEIHHPANNRPDDDMVWRPLDLRAYRRRSAPGRVWYRLCRTTPGLGLYYLWELWARELMGLRPSAPLPRSLWPGRLVPVAMLAVGGVAGWVTGGPTGALALTIAPLLVVSWAIGFVVYFNHTHPAIPWGADDELLGGQGANQYRCTVQLTYPAPMAHFLGNIMEHTAHHVHPGVPLTNLRAAQRRLGELLGSEVLEQRWSPSIHRAILRTCRLYDFDGHRWLDWTGEPTADTFLARADEPGTGAAPDGITDDAGSTTAALPA